MFKNNKVVVTQVLTNISDTVRVDNKELFTPTATGTIEMLSTAKEKELKKEIFNLKFNYDVLLNFTQQLLTHEQHILFAAKKKEIFG